MLGSLVFKDLERPCIKVEKDKLFIKVEIEMNLFEIAMNLVEIKMNLFEINTNVEIAVIKTHSISPTRKFPPLKTH